MKEELTSLIIILQLNRKLYDFLSHKHFILFGFMFIFVILTFLPIGELILISRKSFDYSLNLFNDNLLNINYQNQLCNNFPIDAVYTWVNGSDQKLIKHLNIIKLNIEFSKSCEKLKQQRVCKQCVQAPILVINPLTFDIARKFKNITRIENYNDTTLLFFSDVFSVQQQIENVCQNVFMNRDTVENYAFSLTFIKQDQLDDTPKTTIYRRYYEKSSDVNKIDDKLIKCSSLIFISNLSDNLTESNFLKHSTRFIRKNVKIINYFDEGNKKSILLEVKSDDGDKLVKALQISLNKSLSSEDERSLIKINYPVELMIGNENIINNKDITSDLSSSRFADNDELKYSLRSIEQHAPWIRRVYIVTNGQIPVWLDMNNPRVKIITHQEIFRNKSHLPTFSSPSIETHIHRIPNLSRKFLYFNDDLLLGKQVWPEDFYTNAKGYKIYLSWPVPNCADGCPMNWLKDGSCDKACNTSMCLWDGGDCENVKSHDFDSIYNSYFNKIGRIRHDYNNNDQQYSSSDFDLDMTGRISKQFCSLNCANSWLYDKFCDAVCNNEDCAYDIGDCGFDNYAGVYSEEFIQDKSEYNITNGLNVINFNFTNFLQNNNTTIISAKFDYHPKMRLSKYNFDYNILTLLLYSKQNECNLTGNVLAKRDDHEFNIKFKVYFENKNSTDLERNDSETFVTQPDNKTEEVLQSLIKNKNKIDLNFTDNFTIDYSLPCDFNISDLPLDLKKRIKDLERNQFNNNTKFNNTTKFNNQQMELIKLYVNQLCNIETTIKDFDITTSSFKWEQQSFLGNKNDYSLTLSSTLSSSLLSTSNDRWQNNNFTSRRLLDTFGDSLRHVNYLYNKVFGVQMRKVPPHMPHFIDTEIMSRLQNQFQDHFDETSSHKIRSYNDMQFAFSYYYFLMSEQKEINNSEIFDKFDIDNSEFWSHNEIRNVIIYLYDLPIERKSIKQFYSILKHCCFNLNNSCHEQMELFNLTTYTYRPLYFNHDLKISRFVIENCENITDKFKNDKNFITVNYNYEITNEDEVSFKMINSDMTRVMKDLDDITKNPKKFICLNDNIDHLNSKEAMKIKQMLRDFYETMFPQPSQFELPQDQFNKFLYIEDHNEFYQKENEKTNYTIFLCIIFCLFIILIILKILLRIKKLTSNKVSRFKEANDKYWV